MRRRRHLIHRAALAPNTSDRLDLIVAQIAIAVDPHAVGLAVGHQLQAPREIVCRAVAVHQGRNGHTRSGRGLDLRNFAQLRRIGYRMRFVRFWVAVVRQLLCINIVPQIEQLCQRARDQRFVETAVVLHEHGTPKFHHRRPVHRVEAGEAALQCAPHRQSRNP